MERKLQIRELSEQTRRKVIKAMYGDHRIALMDGRKPVAWVVGSEDIRTLRDYDRVRRRLEQRFEQRLSEMRSDLANRIDMTRRVGKKIRSYLRVNLGIPENG